MLFTVTRRFSPASLQPRRGLWLSLFFICIVLLSFEHAGAQITDEDFANGLDLTENTAETGETPEFSLGTEMGKVLVALGVVLGLIGLTVWAAKRYLPHTRTQGRSPQAIRIVTSQNLGSRKHLLLVEVRSKTLLLGVTPHRIDCLSEIEFDNTAWETSAHEAGITEGVFDQPNKPGGTTELE